MLCSALALPASTANASVPGINKLGCSAYGTGSTDSTFTTPQPVQRLVLKRVRLPKASLLLHWPRKQNLDGPDRFIKYGIVVTAGSPVTLSVPKSAQPVYALNFGNPVQTVAASRTSVRLSPCPRKDGFATAWPGGYLVTKPACVPLIVTVDGRSTTVSLSLGHRC
jgi:hypothetical protein